MTLINHFSNSASPYGLGVALLLYIMPDGTEKMVSYASRNLQKVARIYSQVEKEALAIV